MDNLSDVFLLSLACRELSTMYSLVIGVMVMGDGEDRSSAHLRHGAFRHGAALVPIPAEELRHASATSRTLSDREQ